MSSSSSSRGKCRQISFDAIKDGTDDFAERNVLGKGGEGKVYLANIKLGWMLTQVAVKQLSPDSTQFRDEIQTMSNIQHKHVVSLLGYCDEPGQKLLIYEYMENGSLASYVRKTRSTILPWMQRLRICLDAARGLQHLHVPTQQHGKGIIHRDIKPDNILLGKDWVAKISDFGMFKVSQAGQEESVMETNLKGTCGYFAPEYNMHRRVTRKIDVYCFGIVLFQVLCLKMPWDRGDTSYNTMKEEDLGVWAEQNVDSEIEADIGEDSLKAYTAIIRYSLKHNPDDRPTMNDVVPQLEKAIKFQEIYEEKANIGRAARESDTHTATAGSNRGPTRVVSEKIDESDYNRTIVLDIGGGITKAGFAGEEDPEVVFTTGIGHARNYGGSSRTYTGKELTSYMGDVTLRNPIKDGIVVGWADYEKIIHHTLYNELDYVPENKHPVFLTEPPLKHDATDEEKREYKTNRENMVAIMFDKFDVPALYIGVQPVLSLYANGKTTGLVIESGEGMTHSVPIYEGHVLPHAVTSLSFAGRGITDHFMKIFNEERGQSFSTQAHRNIVQEVKEKMAYVALDYMMELKNSQTKKKSYTLPDGKLITVGQELFQCPEALFNPSIVGNNELGIDENINNSIVLCAEEIRGELCQSIVLSGGSTMLTGFSDRIEKEMRGLVPSWVPVKIVAHPKRNLGAWIGGSIIASLDTMDKMWITRKEYDDYGPKIVHKKCF